MYAQWRKSKAITLTKIPEKNRVTRGAKTKPTASAVAHQGAMQYGQETKWPIPRWNPRPRGSSSTSPAPALQM
jgi:hypothetical protein